MLISLLVFVAYSLIALITLFLSAFLVRKLLAHIFGENFNLTYVDQSGQVQRLRIRANNDEDLIMALQELKRNARAKKVS